MCPIGRPLQNVILYFSIETFSPFRWVYGVNYTSAAIVWLRGYLNRPGLTAEKFILNPFPAQSITIALYKTGDMSFRYLCRR